ncbi:hypothetical protein [Fusobacterium pseudoperiodonticum]|nr:hypothetical protein [Fusobacterium pseudoperiodonticum]
MKERKNIFIRGTFDEVIEKLKELAEKEKKHLKKLIDRQEN